MLLHVVSAERENDRVEAIWQKHTTQHLTCVPQTLMSGVLCVAVFRRLEGKFKKKQNPRDEALQILRPQMDNPPAPQVDAHTPEKCQNPDLDL